MVYGWAGSSKTWFARAAADYVGWERTLWLHTERPIYSFPVHVWTDKEPWGVRYMPNAGCEDLIKVLQPVLLAARQRKWKYDLVILDSITEVDLVNMAHIEDENSARDGRQRWGEQADDMMRLLWSMRAGSRGDSDPSYDPASGEPREPQGLGAYSIVTAAVREMTHPTQPVTSTGERNTIARPGIRGQWGDSGDRYFNHVLYAERIGTQRKLYLKATGSVHVKNDWEHVKTCPAFITVRDYDTGFNVFAETLKACGLTETNAQSAKAKE